MSADDAWGMGFGSLVLQHIGGDLSCFLLQVCLYLAIMMMHNIEEG
jgi:hypothetical protein